MEAFAVFGQLFDQFALIADVFRYVWFLLLPPILYYLFRPIWIEYIADVYADTVPFDMLEIIPPRNSERSPQPMESIFAGLQGTRSSIPTYDDLCLGVFPPSFSFEIVGNAGRVHFYVMLQRNFRPVFESHFYAQYPDVEIRDVADYMDDVPAIIPNKDWDVWGADIELLKPDPVPIKTWQHFEEDITGKMIDPMSGLIEVMGRARRGEYLCLQIIISPEPESWHKEAMAYVDELKGRVVAKPKGLLARMVMAVTGFLAKEGDGGKSDSADAPLEFKLSPVERKVLEAVEENIGRYTFKVKMRMIYTARKEIFDKAMIAGFFGAMKQFADFNLNAFRPYDPSITYALYVFRKTRLRFLQHKLLRAYRKRKMSGKKFRLSDRELATILHMPDMSVVAPSITRSGTTKSTAPANLPIEES